jgi:hypothetical protein
MGNLGDVADRDALVTKGLGGATGGDDLPVELAEAARELDEA